LLQICNKLTTATTTSCRMSKITGRSITDLGARRLYTGYLFYTSLANSSSIPLSLQHSLWLLRVS